MDPFDDAYARVIVEHALTVRAGQSVLIDANIPDTLIRLESQSSHSMPPQIGCVLQQSLLVSRRSAES